MRDVTTHNFGLLIAYLLPGFTALWGVGYFSPTVASWLGTGRAQTPTVGGFLYVTIAAVMAGLTVSTIRWIVVDTIHHRTGISRPDFDYARLEQNVRAFDLLVRHHYDYYKWHANLLVSVAFTYLAHRIAIGFWTRPLTGTDTLVFLLGLVLFVGSRNNLKNYYRRVEMSLGSRDQESPETRKVAASHENGAQHSDQELTKPTDSLH